MIILSVVSHEVMCCGAWVVPVKDEARRTAMMTGEMVCGFIEIPLRWTWGVLIHKDISIIIQRKIT
jgi:hypothetical protein